LKKEDKEDCRCDFFFSVGSIVGVSGSDSLHQLSEQAGFTRCQEPFVSLSMSVFHSHSAAAEELLEPVPVASLSSSSSLLTVTG